MESVLKSICERRFRPEFKVSLFKYCCWHI